MESDTAYRYERIMSIQERSQYNLKIYHTLRKYLSVPFFSALFIIFVLSFSFLKYSIILSPNNLTTSKNSYNIDLSISIVNPDYPEGLVSVKRNYLPWPFIVEPHKIHTATLLTLKIDNVINDVDNFEVKWIVGSQHISSNGGYFTLSDVGNYSSSVIITPKSTSSSKGIVYVHNFYVVAKYVRREIRNMTIGDRANFFDALGTLYTVSDSQGKITYGNKFHSMEYFLTKHLIGAGTTDCDHWHDGAGIVTHHMAYTLEVEQALQAVNPSVSLPYWEYGMDPLLYSDWMTSPIFNDDWFGEVSSSLSDHTITRGFWKDIEIPDGTSYQEWDISKTGTLNPFVNAYNKLRSPWNNNPSPKIGRHNATFDKQTYTMPSCSVFYKCFNYDSLKLINDCANTASHGPVHIMIGGSWEKKVSNVVYNDSVLDYDNSLRLLIFKVLWRKGYSRCPTSCPLDGSKCLCAVPDVYLERFGAEAILEDVNIDFGDDAPDYIWEQGIQLLQDPGIAGEMFSSGAPFDPTFWPLHGAVERMLSLKRITLAKNTSINFNETWDFPVYPTSLSSLHGVCDWSGVSGADDLTLPNCNTEASCPGHKSYDVIEFGDFLNKGETYTNMEFYEFMHPWNLDLPYTYDTFDYDYCISSGYDFDS